METMLHADHVDTSGAYAQRFEVIKDLVGKGILKEVPDEFKATQEHIQQVPAQPVVQQTTTFNQTMNREHADHVDETGEYMREWEAKYGQNVAVETNTQQNSSWKTFLQQIISEEKSKLNI